MIIVIKKNLDQCAVIQFCVKLGYNPTKMYGNIRKTFGESAVSGATTFRWNGLFRSGKKSVKDEERRERLTTTKAFENIAQVEQVLKKGHRVCCRMIVESIGIQKQLLFDKFYRNIWKSYAPTLYRRREQLNNNSVSCQRSLGDDRKWNWFCQRNNYRR